MSKTSAKANARYLSKILKAHQCRDVVIAPGSRNAPMILAFTEDTDYNCVSAPDERSAAFTALGMTIGSKQPVAVICSSGSAVVNFYPAVVEAYYQRLPLVVITADRPLEWVD
ncbi:MAG TPA: 2-succinyl-5-enolpyruvyl-6-hydroxy-3-cyclohexene-1-carboxylic-acid synthase, partial [Cryomorphaceae bacterium]|nr:2-succinyl-5-enolpyruvyl-6-hydroxy-3-cyclohexene-1-carboxylic-acid synthase [Cryomorphaceae bacterium]